MNENDLFFSRTELLIGQEAMLRMERAREQSVTVTAHRFGTPLDLAAGLL